MTGVSPASSSLNFLAGILAGAGINLITSVATKPEAGVPTALVALDSLLWVLSAATLTWAAQVVQRGERDADLQASRLPTDQEIREVRRFIEHRSWRQARLPVALTLVSVIGSVLLLPRFIPWGAFF